ncbi:MAG TPA: glycosyltransferase [Steroidobacteraceae bacterium]|nr:glycosyltransferase [Steroidobacteraceae bacterium]
MSLIRTFSGLIALTAILAANLLMCALSLALFVLRGGRPKAPPAGGGSTTGAIKLVLVAPFAPGNESGGSKAVLDLANTLKPHFDLTTHVVEKNACPGGIKRRLARVLLRPLPIPDHCRDLLFGDASLSAAIAAAHTVFFEFQLTAVYLGFGTTHGKRVVVRDHEVLVRKLDMEREAARGLDSLAWRLRTFSCWLVTLAVYARAHLIITLTEADRAAIARWFPFFAARAVCVPAPFEPPNLASGPSRAGPRELLMVANFFHSPNRDGLRWFLRECAPRLEPGFTLHLCGIDGALTAEHLSSPHLTIVRHGFVARDEDVAALAEIAVAPIVSGGGVRIKNLFLGSLGKALATTPLGNEGIDLVDGVHAMISADGATMAAKLNAAARDPEYVARLGVAAAAHIRARFRQEAVRTRLIDLLRSPSRPGELPG